MVNITQQFDRNAMMPALPVSAFEGAQPTQAGGKPIPFFFRHAVHMPEASAKAGRPIYSEVEMVKIIIPGDTYASPVRRVTDYYRERFAEHYAAFKREEEIAETGTPIDHWGILTMERRYSLKHLGIFTVEQVAALSDEQLQRIGMGGNLLRDQAKAFIARQETGAVPEKLVAENESLRGQITLLTQQMTLLARQFEALSKEKGVDTSKIGDPVAETMVAIAHTAIGDSGDVVSVPPNYKQLGFKQLRDIAGQITAAPVMHKEDALRVIEEYIGRKSAVTG